MLGWHLASYSCLRDDLNYSDVMGLVAIPNGDTRSVSFSECESDSHWLAS